MERFNNAVQICHHMLSSVLKGDEAVVDATVGNGHDLLFAASCTKGTVYGFDIQEQALSSARELLSSNGIQDDRIQLFLSGHERMDEYIKEKVGAVVFNLGYLPGGDKSLTTKAHTTIKAISESLKLLLPQGIVFIVVYPGHAEGKAELAAIEKFLTELPQQEYNIMSCGFPNQRGTPPHLFCIELRI